MTESPGEPAQVVQLPTAAEEYTGAPVAVPNVKPDKKEDADPRQGLPPTVQVEYASAPMKLEQENKKAKGPWIQYNGIGTVRIMGPKEWASVGIKSDDTFQWSYMNKKRIPRNRFSDEQLQYLLRVDGRFSLVHE